MELIPSSGGRFEVSVNGEPFYSKLETGVFPNAEDIIAQLEGK